MILQHHYNIPYLGSKSSEEEAIWDGAKLEDGGEIIRIIVQLKKKPGKKDKDTLAITITNDFCAVLTRN